MCKNFGLARHEDAIDPNAPTMASDPQLTATGAIAGTPAYLAPEQLLGDPIDSRVDQFAWAVMSWELLTGSRPFPIVFAVRVEAVRAGVSQPANLPKHLFDVLARAMSATPADRFPSMRELIIAFRAAPVAAAASPIVPARGRTAAIAGLVVLGASGAALLAWKKSPAPTAAPTIAEVPVSMPPAPTPAEPAATVSPVPAPAPPPPAVAVATDVVRAPALVAAPPKAKLPAKAGKTEVAVAAPTSIPAPAPTTPQVTQTEPQPPIIATPTPAPSRGRYCRSCQIASADAFCRIPTDFANTGLPRNFGVVDWGIVTKVETEAGTFRDETIQETIITLRGQRKTYRFTSDFLDTVVTTNVGAHLAICPEDQNDLYRLSGGPTDLTRAVITMSGPPKTTVAAKLGAKHVYDLALAATSGRKRFDDRITADGTYLVHAKIHGIDGPRYRMDRYWMQVPKGLKNEDKLETNKLYWLVVEKGAFVEIEGNEQLVVKAAAILDDIFPQ